ncbi:hypothetical protein Runsl_1497 [Runella slithyformis DSM 19594]|uniref:Uncharacterized protein n=1 Tax=Runella slithyformis (strain ATCC 29530 / DSM 19594 / LMG 11500 / NCIMB 11436 / LSU 4) TaxID=761193 RepID=A0A7U3ZIP5_RUNSL|nr:hypothetical protein Runsl_1497 [Runella slithyformis DSM 19594]
MCLLFTEMSFSTFKGLKMDSLCLLPHELTEDSDLFLANLTEAKQQQCQKEIKIKC